MLNFMETIISAVKSWIKHDAFTADEAVELAINMEIIEPLIATDGTIYTSPEGEILTL